MESYSQQLPQHPKKFEVAIKQVVSTANLKISRFAVIQLILVSAVSQKKSTHSQTHPQTCSNYSELETNPALDADTPFLSETGTSTNILIPYSVRRALRASLWSFNYRSWLAKYASHPPSWCEIASRVISYSSNTTHLTCTIQSSLSGLNATPRMASN